MKLFLFDIDGTLLTTDGAGRAALKSAGADLFAIEEDLRTINVSGSTDTAIVQEILQHHSLDVSTANVNRYLGGYLVWLRQHLASLSGAILPGVISLLDVLAQDGHAIGLLTGNVRRGAEIKLTAHGIWDRFSFGAFGDDNSDRNGALKPPSKSNSLRRTFLSLVTHPRISPVPGPLAQLQSPSLRAGIRQPI
jgi:phosphoglycolate phosphatase